MYIFLRNLAIVLVLDLSKPEELWFTMDRLLTYIRNRVDTVLSEGKSNDPYLKEDLEKKMWQRLGDCPDKDMMNPLLVPLVIIGAKFDLFQVSDLLILHFYTISAKESPPPPIPNKDGF